MEDSRSLRRELDRRVAELSDDQVREVLGFTEVLRRRNRRLAEEPPASPASDHDQLLDLIGSVSVEPFADDIEEALYGA